MPAIDQPITKPVATDYDPRMNDGPRSDHGVFVQHGVRKDGHTIADATSRHHSNATMDANVVAELHICFNGGQRVDGDVAPKASRGTDDSPRADAGPGLTARRVKVADD